MLQRDNSFYQTIWTNWKLQDKYLVSWWLKFSYELAIIEWKIQWVNDFERWMSYQENKLFETIQVAKTI